MTRTKALELLQKYAEYPIFTTRIGMCSPQVEHVTFEHALQHMDACSKFTTELMEYVYITVMDEFLHADDLNKALVLFNLGAGRHALNVKRFT